MFCTNCGQSAQPGRTRCGHCNFKLPETALPSASAGLQHVVCWNCSHANPAHAPRCTQCNARLEEANLQPGKLAKSNGQITSNTSSHDQ